MMTEKNRIQNNDVELNTFIVKSHRNNTDKTEMHTMVSNLADNLDLNKINITAKSKHENDKKQKAADKF